MGYFSNGTEGLIFQETYCERCLNWRDLDDGRGPGCPVYDSHLLYAYELCNAGDHPGKVLLDLLIKRTEVGGIDGNECQMFLPRDVAAVA